VKSVSSGRKALDALREVDNSASALGNRWHTQPQKSGLPATIQSIPLGIDNPSPPETYESALSSAIEQQLGLKLEPRKASMEVLVIDHVERPSDSRAQSSTAKARIYEVASIKPEQTGTTSLQTGKGIIRQRLLLTPGVFAATNVSTPDLIRTVYGVKNY
jgi:hypothetical protein